MQKPTLNEGINAREQSSLWAKLSFSWIHNYINVAKSDYYNKPIVKKDGTTKENKRVFSVKMLGNLYRPSTSDSKEEEDSLARCESNFQHYVTKALTYKKNNNQKLTEDEMQTGDNYALLKTMLMTEKVRFFQVFMIQVFMFIMQAGMPFVVYKLTSLLEERNLTESKLSEIAKNPDFESFEEPQTGFSIISMFSTMSSYSKNGIMWAFLLMMMQNCETVASRLWDLLKEFANVRTLMSVRLMLKKKIMSVSPATNRKYSDADIRKMSTTDLDRMEHAMWIMGDKFTIPLWLVVSLGWLLYALDVKTVLTFLFMNCFQGYFNYLNNNSLHPFHKEEEKLNKNCREELTQIITNIKFLKQYGWKDLFYNRYVEANEKAMKQRKTIRKREKVRDIGNEILYHLRPILSFYIFFNNSSSNGSVMLSLATMSVTQAYFDRLGHLVNCLAHEMNFLTDMKRSMETIQNFLMSDEVQKYNNKSKNVSSQDSIKMTGNFSWGLTKDQRGEDKEKKDEDKKKDEEAKKQVEEKKVPLKNFITLKDMDVTVKKGEFVAIVGDIGSGKTSMLKSILGEMVNLENDIVNKVLNTLDTSIETDEATRVELTSQLLGNCFDKNRPVHEVTDGSLQVNGPICYVEQEPWIQSKSVRDNIVFKIRNEVFQEANYVNTVRACQLESDFQKFESGDMTLVGDRGIMLSGGQKARVCLARAVYRAMELNDDNTIVLMDDPVSALDTHVRQMVFEQVIQGLLKDKTRILATHAVEFMQLADKVIVLDKGRIVDIGKFSDLEERCDYIKKINQVHKDNFFDVQAATTGEQETVHSQDQDSASTGSKSQENSGSDNEFVEISDPVMIKKKLIKYAQKDKIKEGDSDDEQSDSEEAETSNKNIISLNNADVTWETYKQFFQVIGGYKLLGLLMVVMLINKQTEFYRELQFASWTQESQKTDADDKNNRFTTNQRVFLSLLLCTAVHTVKDLAWFYMTQSAKKKTVLPTLKRVLNAPVNKYFDQTPISLLETRLNEDVNFVTHCFHTFGWMSDLIIGALTFACVTLYTIPSMIVVFFLVCCLLVRNQQIRFKAIEKMKGIDEKTSVPKKTIFTEAVNGNNIIRCYQKQENYVLKTFDLITQNETMHCFNKALWSWMWLRNMFLGSMMTFFSYVLAFSCGNNKNIIGLYFATICTNRVFHHMNWTYEAYDRIQDQMKKVSNVFKVQTCPQEKIEESEVDFKIEKGELSINNIDLRYREDRELVLRKLNFKVEAGLKVGIVGRTGAGKSTISNALTRIVELDSGSIEIDGQNIADADLSQLRSQITIIPQDPTLLEGTLKFNLDPENQASEEKLISLCQKAGIDKIFNKGDSDSEQQQNCLEQKIEGSGKNLSAGERQLICLCRAVLRDNKVVILDEATASIDVLTEQKVQALISEEFKNATVLTIAHRINTIVRCDRVLVLQAGEVLEYGVPSELACDSKSHFSAMIEQIKVNAKDFI